MIISFFFNSVFFSQYELLFCIEDKCDPAISVVETLMQKYPMIDSKLFIGEYSWVIDNPINKLINSINGIESIIIEWTINYIYLPFSWINGIFFLCIYLCLFTGGSNVGVNPKINNMHPGYEAAKYELVMISDSGIRSKCSPSFDSIAFIFFSIIFLIKWNWKGKNTHTHIHCIEVY